MMDLLSYERDSRWLPHLSWSFIEQRMERQAAQREQAWQKIADKLGPLLIPDVGCSFGQSDYISRDIEEQDYAAERAYEKAPLLTTQVKLQSSQRLINQQLATQEQQHYKQQPTLLHHNHQYHRHYLIEPHQQQQQQQQSQEKVNRRTDELSLGFFFSVLVVIAIVIIVVVYLCFSFAKRTC